jgi:hypothetical protein
MNASDEPRDTGTGGPSRLLIGRDVLLPAAIVTSAALATIPLPRALAWFALLLIPGVLGHHVTKSCGLTAAVTSCLMYLWAHGDPRFALTITDQWTIRCAFLLGILGAVGAHVGGGHVGNPLPARRKSPPGH